MDKLHKKLMQQSPLYAKMHKHRGLQLIQWLVLVLIILGFSTLIYHRVTDLRGQSYGLNSKADQDLMGHQDFSGITAELLNTAQTFKKASPEEKNALKLNLEKLAQQRKQLMLDTLDKNPKAVARAAIPAGLLKQMPSEIANFLEKPVTVEGTADVIHTDFFDEDKAEYDYFITGSNHAKYHIRTNGLLDRVVTGTKVKVTGVALNDNLVPQDSSTGIVITAQASIASITQKKLAVIIVSFQDSPAISTPDEIRAHMFTDPDSVNKYYQENSYGKWELIGSLHPDGDIFGAYTIPYNNVDCNTNWQTWASAAESLAAKDGFIPANYNTIVYQLKYTSGCGWSGRSSIGGSPARSWLATDTFNISVATHEIGHSFYMLHSSSLKCTDSAGNPVSIANNCPYIEYGDPYDVMGYGLMYHVNNYHKGQTGTYAPNSWIPTSNVVTISSGQSGTYTLVPMETSSTGIQTIRIPRNYSVTDDTGYQYTISPGYYYLEYRQPSGFDDFSANPYLRTDGVIIRLGADFNNANNTQLVDTTPGTPSDYNALLTAGRTFTDSAYGISITTQSVSPTGAVVSITSTAAPCGPTNPSLSISPNTQSANSGNTLTYTYTLTNRDDNNCAASNFTVVPTLPSGWFQTPASFTETLAPGTSVTRSFNVTSSSGAALASYNITENASNASNSTYQATATAQYVVTNIDTAAPTATITAPTGGAVKAKSTVTIAVTAIDNVSVTRVDFVVNGVATCSDTIAPYTCVWKVPAGKKVYDIIVRPYDAAGNVGYAHIAVQAR